MKPPISAKKKIRIKRQQPYETENEDILKRSESIPLSLQSSTEKEIQLVNVKAERQIIFKTCQADSEWTKPQSARLTMMPLSTV